MNNKEPPSTLHSEKAMATHSSTLAWKSPWMEKPGTAPRVSGDCQLPSGVVGKAVAASEGPRNQSAGLHLSGTAFPEHRGAGPGQWSWIHCNRLELPGCPRARRGPVASCQTMLSRVCGRFASALRGTRAPPSAVTLRCLHASSSRPSTDKSERTEKPPRAFDQALLEFLVCPLSKKPLRAHRKMALPSLPAVRWSHVTRFQLMECEGRCLLPQPSLDFAVRKKMFTV
ncbi:protein preY, mitochondrial isoform 1-T1 [Dama dama]